MSHKAEDWMTEIKSKYSATRKERLSDSLVSIIFSFDIHSSLSTTTRNQRKEILLFPLLHTDRASLIENENFATCKSIFNHFYMRAWLDSLPREWRENANELGWHQKQIIFEFFS